MPVKRYNDFVNEGDETTGNQPVQQNDDDLEFLNNLLGDAPKREAGEIGPGDRITYYKDGSEHDGKSGSFVGIRDDGKWSLRFDDGKRFAANSKNVVEFGKKKPEAKKKIPDNGILEIPEEKLGRAKWGPGAFEVPDSFFGSKNVDKQETDKYFKKGDNVVYTNPKSEHDGKKGTIIDEREDGKYSIRFADGGRFAANPKNIKIQEDGVFGKIKRMFLKDITKNDFTVKIGEIKNPIDELIGALIVLKDGSVFDDDILRKFVELRRIGFDEGDGDMDGLLVYTGDLTKEELVDELKERDFKAEMGKL